MQKLKIRQGDWVVVCDGKKALVLENAGDEKLLNLKTRAGLPSGGNWDRRARACLQLGGSRPPCHGTDRWHAAEEDRFLRELAQHFDAPSMPDEANALILIAPPRRVCGKTYSHGLRAAIAPKSTRISSGFRARSRSILQG
jgi:protein required for attachment to host cells